MYDISVIVTVKMMYPVSVYPVSVSAADCRSMLQSVFPCVAL